MNVRRVGNAGHWNNRRSQTERIIQPWAEPLSEAIANDSR